MRFPLDSHWFTPRVKQILGALAAVLFLFLLARPIFKDYFSEPNSMMYAFGGDALMLYYNTAYHTRYDDGSTLRSMNYPDGEYVYLTDAQGAISTTMQWINRNLVDISQQTVGFVNAINLYLLFVAVIFTFFLLRALKVHLYSAILFSPFIVLLSPQIHRMGGHFGLAYPFLIPMAMLWFLRKYRLGYVEKRDALMLGVSLFFTFNNAYTGFNVSFFLVLAGLLVFISEGFKWAQWKKPAIISGMGLLSLGLVFLNFKLFDPVPDRLNPQWGFFVFHASFEGLFHPQGSILYDWLTRNQIMAPLVQFEAMLNVGIVTTLALVLMLLLTLIAPLFRKYKPTLQRIAPEHRVLIGASLILFLLAANTSLLPLSETWLEQNMSWLLMFKASARLGWTMFFALGVTAVVFLDKFFLLTSHKYLVAIALFAIAAGWNAEINQYIKPRYKDVFHTNFFGQQKEAEMLAVLNQNKVNIDEYQAILSLPKMMAWSDKILSTLHFRTQITSTQLSLATGLPMVNAMLSRIGLQHTLERVQMYANPLVERTLLQKFPNQKDILLVIGTDPLPELSVGEKFLIDISERVVETKEYSLYRLKLSDLANNTIYQNAKADYAAGKGSKPIYHLNFDEKKAEQAFYGAGSYQVNSKEEVLGTFVSPFEKDTIMNFSAWTYLDKGRWRCGFWVLKVKDQAGAELQTVAMETRKSNDVQDTWIRAEARCNLPKGGQVSVIAITETPPMMIDEVMLWPKGSIPVVDDPEAKTYLFENFKIKR